MKRGRKERGGKPSRKWTSRTDLPDNDALADSLQSPNC